MPANTGWHSRRTEASLRLPAKKTLDQSILKGVKANNYNPAAASKKIERLLQRNLEVLQFLVDRNSQRLESPCCRVNPATCPSNGLLHYLGKFQGGSQRTSLHNTSRYLPTSPFFAISIQKLGQLRLPVGIDDICCGKGLFIAEPHVQRRILLEAKAATCLLKLERGHAKIEENAIYRAKAISGTDILQVSEVLIDQDDISTIGLEFSPGHSERAGVSIDAD